MLERIPLRFCKDMLGLPLNASNVAVYNETGTCPQLLRNFYRAIKYYVRIHTTAPCLVVDALELLKKTSGRNWNRSICEILRKYEPRQNTTEVKYICRSFDSVYRKVLLRNGQTIYGMTSVLVEVINCAHIVPSKQSLHGNTTCQL